MMACAQRLPASKEQSRGIGMGYGFTESSVLNAFRHQRNNRRSEAFTQTTLSRGAQRLPASKEQSRIVGAAGPAVATGCSTPSGIKGTIAVFLPVSVDRAERAQ